MKKKTRWPLYAILALVLTFLAFVVPLPYYIEVPGGAEDIRQVLKVNETSPERCKGHFLKWFDFRPCFVQSFLQYPTQILPLLSLCF